MLPRFSLVRYLFVVALVCSLTVNTSSVWADPEIARFETKRDIDAVSLSPDGSRILISSRGTLTIWDTKISDERRRIIPYPNTFEDPRYAGDNFDGLVWLPDGEHFVTWGTSYWPVRIWNANSGKMVRELPTAGSRVGVSPNGKWIAIYVGLELPERKKLGAVPPEEPPSRVRKRADLVRIYDLANGNEVACLKHFKPDSTVRPMIFSADSKQLLTFDDSSSVFDTATWKLAYTLEPGDRGAGMLFYLASPDGESWVGVAETPQRELFLRRWDTRTGKMFREVGLGTVKQVHEGKLFSSGKELLISGFQTTSGGGSLFSVDVTSGEVVADRAWPQYAPQHLTFSANGKHVAASVGNRSVVVWDATKLSGLPPHK